MLEAGVTNEVLVAMSKQGTRLFRNNVAVGWAANPTDTKRFPDGSVYLKNPRVLHAGLCKGSSDYIGWHPLTITVDMIGREMAIFSSIEMKRSAGGRLSPEQKNFIAQVRSAGGLAGVANSVETALQLYDQLHAPR